MQLNRVEVPIGKPRARLCKVSGSHQAGMYSSQKVTVLDRKRSKTRRGLGATKRDPSHFENASVGAQSQRLNHNADNIGLGDGLLLLS